ncbi:MAG: helix-turn-helix transcriptional regulator [Pseudonocardiales bacterium]|nr:helix-turn-helix transcriptional regulator [Pseudonocardiales bacterium]
MARPTPPGDRDALFPALLRHWRSRRGLSQLDLAVTADVSVRHVSFLETGRSSPSEEMVLRLSSALGVPLRHTNALLRAAGHRPRYPESAPGDDLPTPVRSALETMKAHHEPYPLLVVDRTYRVIDANQGARTLLGSLLPGPGSGGREPNLARLVFEQAGVDLIANHAAVARELLWRIHREVLADPGNEALRTLLDGCAASGVVEEDWRAPDLTEPSAPGLLLQLRQGDAVLSFLVVVSLLQAPFEVALEDLRIESWYPADEATARAYASAGSPVPDP